MSNRQCSLNIDPFLFCSVLNFLIVFFVFYDVWCRERVLSTFTWVLEIKLKLWSSLSGHKCLICLPFCQLPVFFEAKSISWLALNSQQFPWCSLSRAGMFAGFLSCSTSQLSTTQRLVINCKCSADSLDLLLTSFIYALSCGSTFFFSTACSSPGSSASRWRLCPSSSLFSLFVHKSCLTYAWLAIGHLVLCWISESPLLNQWEQQIPRVKRTGVTGVHRLLGFEYRSFKGSCIYWEGIIMINWTHGQTHTPCTIAT